MSLIRKVDIRDESGAAFSNTNPLFVHAAGEIDSTNSSSTILGIGGVFTGVSHDITEESVIIVSVFSDVASATDGLTAQFSIDNTNWDFTDSFTIPAGIGKTFSFQPKAQYYRLIYTNGGTGQTSFRLQTLLKSTYVKPSNERISDSITTESASELVKAVITGQNPAGTFTNVKTTNEGLLKVGLEAPLTAFGDLRNAELSPQFQYSFEYTVDNTDLTTNTVVNGGTVTQANAMAVVTSSTTTASTALLKSKIPARYRAGLGGLIRFTALFTTGVAATEQYIGLMDEVGGSAAFENGYAIGYNGASLSILRWQNDALTSVAQSSWDDPLDGTGTSKITIIPTNLNVFEIGFQYLGAGAISFYVEDENTGVFIRFHTIKYANQNITPSVYNPNFHFTIWVNNKATISNLILKSASVAYFVEGKTSYVELQQPQNSTGVISLGSVTTEVAIFTIRNKSSYASKTNFIDIILENLTTAIEASAANNLGSYRLIRNATLGGSPSYTDINTSDSIVDYDTAGTTVTNGKTLIAGNLAGKNDKDNLNLLPYKIILAPGETVTLAGLSAASATIEGSLLWKELF